MSPPDEIPSFKTAPFLGGGWKFRPGSPLESLETAESYFYLLHPAEVEFHIEGRGRGQARVSLNGEQVSDFTLGQKWSRLVIPLPNSNSGLNKLDISGVPGAQWRRLHVTLKNRAGLPTKPLIKGNDVFIPFGFTADFLLPGSGDAEFAVDGVESWTLSGSATDAAWKLSIESGSLEQTVEGRCQLQLHPGGDNSFTMSATCPNPLPGQIGLKLSAPRISYQKRVTPPSPSRENQPPQVSNPNVLIVLSDTLRADHLGCYGYDRPTSPEIDEFSKEATLYENAVAQSSWTRPSVASIFTGRLPHQHGTTSFLSGLNSDEETLAETLHSAGYRTTAFVSNGLVNWSGGFGEGFQLFENEPGEEPEQLTDEVLDWLPRGKEQPFLIYVHYLQPHTPNAPGAEFRKKLAANANDVDYPGLASSSWQAFWDPSAKELDPRLIRDYTELYDAEIAQVSRSFGRILQELKDDGRYDQTLILFLSDHGEEIHDHGSFGHINSLYQEIVHVPLIIKYPKGWKAGQRVSQPVQHVDIVPTVKDVTGIPIGTATGTSLYRGEPDEERFLFSSVNAGKKDPAYRDWLYEGQSVRSGPWVLIRTEAEILNRSAPFELYNLIEDPEQRTNLYYEKPGVAILLGTALRATFDSEPHQEAPERKPDKQILKSLQYTN